MFYPVGQRSGGIVRLASFFCKMMIIIGDPDAEIAHSASNLSIFWSAMRWSGNRKADRKNAAVVISYIMDVCNEENPARWLLSGN